MTPTNPTAARRLAQLSQRQAIYFDQLTRRTPEAAGRDGGGVNHNRAGRAVPIAARPAANEVRKRISMSQPTSNNHIRDRQTGQRELFAIGGGA